MRPTLAIAVLVAAVCAPSAAAADFDRGDVLASVGTPSAIARFAPDGTPKGELADSAGAGPLCFDASGEHLIAPGAGLYDSAGSLLASDWATVDLPGACVVDKAGNVFVGGGPSSGGEIGGRAVIRRFDLTGHPLGSYDVDASGFAYGRAVTGIDLAPDQCTIYYDLDGGDEIKRYDVCTATQGEPFGTAGPVCDHLRVRPGGDVVVTCDTYGTLLDPAGAVVHDFGNPVLGSTASRFAVLDPDGSSFWMGSYQGLLTRFDIVSGQRLGGFSAGGTMRGVAVYSPPPPAQQHTETSVDPGTTQSEPSTATPAAATPAQATMPALAIAHGRLVVSGRSLLLDTGLRATCPATGPACRATVTLTIAGAVARAAGVTGGARVGALKATIAPGASARLVVRLSRKGAALVRRRRPATVAVRVSLRAGNGPALVRKTNVRLGLRRSR